MASWLYEALLLFAMGLIATLVFSVAIDMRSGMDSRRWLLQGFLAVVFGIYFSFFWSKGQTLPMKTWRITVVDRHGQRLTQGRALLRYVFCSIWVLPPLAALASRQFTVAQLSVIFFGWVAVWAVLSRFHPQGQFWHDAWAGTRLVDAR
ncbi:RDD family protein [Ramlibacter pallidus]|uniref:RDD family protein n=1 Tax=Ramlibacter pallidus TaxID=2780087 RepID=A0ABR9S422_9BURK|nr:RDD family protein [Ramlibacter pallidus]MBE7368047.1 RDD family protein [Ramlibacter pallidus]